MFQAADGKNNSFWCATASACENDVEWVIGPERACRRGFTELRKLCCLVRRKDERWLSDSQDVVNAFKRKGCVNRDIRPAGFYHTDKGDKHFRFAMPKDCDWSAVFAEPFQQLGSQGIRMSA